MWHHRWSYGVKKLDKDLEISFQQMDAKNLDFSEASFDAAFSMATIEFIPDKDKKEFVREMLRIVKSGGKVLVGTITTDSEWGEKYKKQAKSKKSVFHHAGKIKPNRKRQTSGQRRMSFHIS